MDRPTHYTFVKKDGQPGWKIPYPYGVLPSSGLVCAIDPQGVSHAVSRKSLTKH